MLCNFLTQTLAGGTQITKSTFKRLTIWRPPDGDSSSCKTTKKNPNLPVLTCVNTLLMSSWAQSLILGHTEFKQMMMIVMLSFKIEDYHWYEPAHSLANHLSNKQFHSQTLSQEPSWGNCFWFVFCNQDPLSYSRFEKNGNRRSSQRSLSPNGASKRDCVDDAFMEIHGYSIELHSKK